jgi:hypothetical protein
MPDSKPEPTFIVGAPMTVGDFFGALQRAQAAFASSGGNMAVAFGAFYGDVPHVEVDEAGLRQLLEQATEE